MGRRRYTIKQLPAELRPRERLLSEGPEALSSAELLGILFGIGSREKTAVELAGEVISENGDLFGLYSVSMQDRNHEDDAPFPRAPPGRWRSRGALRAGDRKLISMQTPAFIGLSCRSALLSAYGNAGYHMKASGTSWLVLNRGSREGAFVSGRSLRE
jgi:hypothetical protein